MPTTRFVDIVIFFKTFKVLFTNYFLSNKVVSVNDIPDGWMGLDVGPQTIADIQAGLADCKTVIWNGPMGM